MDNFWEKFWPNFIANLSVAFIFGYLFVKFITWYKRPRLSLVINKEKTGEMDWISIMIRNNGRTAMNIGDINWQVYIPLKLKYEPLEFANFPFGIAGESEILGEKCNHLREYNQRPVFPEREICIARLSINEIPQKAVRVYYHFSTVLGLQPKWVHNKIFEKKTFWHTKIQDKEGNPKFHLLPYVELDYNK